MVSEYNNWISTTENPHLFRWGSDIFCKYRRHRRPNCPKRHCQALYYKSNLPCCVLLADGHENTKPHNKFKSHFYDVCNLNVDLEKSTGEIWYIVYCIFNDVLRTFHFSSASSLASSVFITRKFILFQFFRFPLPWKERKKSKRC